MSLAEPNTVGVEELLAADAYQLHPVYHPSKHTNPLIVERADGVYLQDVNGRRVLDAMAGLWNVNIGYGNQEIPEVAAEQMRKLAFTSNFAGMTNVPSAQLAERLAGIAHPTLNTTFFASGGSEANDTAFKTARYYWYRMGKKDKFKIIARKYAYHGITVATTAATGIASYKPMFGPMAPGFLHVDAPRQYRYEGDIKPGESVGQAAARSLEECILAEGPDTVAAFIAEPIQGVGGVLIPPDDYFPLIRAICDKYDVLLILDEVITGFGRTGTWFGQQQFDIRPDIFSFAKGITSGYIQLGGIQVSDEIRESIWNAPVADMWMHGYTYSGHAAACAVGLKNIEIMERERLVENSVAMGERLLEGLKGMLEFSFVGDVRGRGLLCAVEIVKDKESKTPDPARAAALADMCLAQGVRTRTVSSVLAFSPPLCINEQEVDEIIRVVGAVLDGAPA